jgi:hypothetical protein
MGAEPKHKIHLCFIYISHTQPGSNCMQLCIFIITDTRHRERSSVEFFHLWCYISSQKISEFGAFWISGLQIRNAWPVEVISIYIPMLAYQILPIIHSVNVHWTTYYVYSENEQWL